MFKIISHFATIILLFVSFLTQAQEKQAWSLRDCIDYAYEHNLDLQRSQNAVTAKEYNLQQAKNNRLPSVSGSASWNNNYGRSLDYQTNSYTTQNSSNVNYGLGTSVNLFSGFSKKHQIEKAGIDLQASLQNIETLRENIALSITSYYLNILYAVEQLQVAKDNLAITQKQMEQMETLVEAGKKPKGNLLEQQSQVAEKESSIVEAENRLSLSYLELYQLLDVKGEEAFEIEKPQVNVVDNAHGTLLNYSNRFEEIIAERPEMKAYELRLKSAETDVKIAKAAYYPSLNFNASIGSGYSNRLFDYVVDPNNPSGLVKGDRMSFADQYENNLSKSWGLSLSIPIFSKMQNRTAVKNARLQMEDVQIQKQQEQNKIYKELQQAYTNATAAVKKYDAQQKSVAALEETYRYAEEKYKLGMLSYYDFNEALNSLSGARSAMLQAKYEYIFRTKILEYYSGLPLQF